MISIRFGSFIFTIFGLFTSLGFLSGIFMMYSNINKDVKPLMFAIIGTILGNILDSKNFNNYITLNYKEIKPRFYSFGSIFGYLLSILTLHFFYDIPLSLSWFSLLKGLLILSGIGRLGCHYYGCCYGKICDSNIYGIKYNDEDALVLRECPHFKNKLLYPVQLVESIFFITSGSYLYYLNIMYNYNVGYPNIIIYCLFRSFINKYRNDSNTQNAIMPIISMVIL